MEEKLELVDQRLQTLCPGGNKLSKELGLIFSLAVNKMALAKNIKLAEGTLAVWEECLIEDLYRGCFDFDDFLLAMKETIRLPTYNRIDYSDIYGSALNIAFKRIEEIWPQTDEAYRRLCLVNNFIAELKPDEERSPLYRVFSKKTEEKPPEMEEKIEAPIKTMLEGVGERI